ncbi:MAG: tryptophan transporter, partial [Clostridium sp.]|nr:tryptophan transporter [Clostridium sp.]
YKTALFSGIIIGIFTAITTKTVGGQAPNIIDKVITANVAYLMLLPLRNKVNKNIQAALLLVVGTFVSGTVFLTSMMIFVGMPMKAIPTGLLTVVLPTALVNVIIGIIIFNIVNQAIKQVHLNMN